MTRYIIPTKPCPKCGSQMGRCETSGMADVWGISECKNLDCDGYKDVHDLIKEGGVVQCT